MIVVMMVVEMVLMVVAMVLMVVAMVMMVVEIGVDNLPRCVQEEEKEGVTTKVSQKSGWRSGRRREAR